MTSAFFFGQNVNLTGEFGMRMNGTGFSDNLSSFDVLSVDTTEKCTNVVACLSFVKELTEHFETGNNGVRLFFLKTDDFSGIANFSYATFNSSGSNGTTTGDREYVFNREKEGLVVFSFGAGDIAVNSVHEFENALAFGSCKDFFVGSAGRSFFQSFERGTLDNGSLVSGESVFGKKISDFFFNEHNEFFIVNLIAFVQEYYDVRNANLTSEKDVFSGLGHRTVGSCNNEDSTVHLSSAGNHVLNIVGVARAVNVSIVTFVGLILNVSGVDRNTSCLFFGCFIDFVISHLLSIALTSKNHSDSSS